MTYTIGDRKITLDNELSPSDMQLVLAHSKLFKYCLNNATYKFLINLKKLVHLYTDIVTIYATLLGKIPNYEDITRMTRNTRANISNLETDFNSIFGETIHGSLSKKFNWEEKNYEHTVKDMTLLILDSSLESFELIIKNLNCIDIFFNNFDNLKKLLIPYLLSQTKSIHKSLHKAHYLYKLTTITDDIASLKELTPPIIKQLKKIEKITSGIERESIILETAFMTFDPSLQSYTSILLGKAILKRSVDDRDCQIIKRREVCFQAAEHVVSIPLTEDQSSSLSMKQLAKYFSYVAIVVVGLLSVMLYRLLNVLIGRSDNA
ncbi:uncharacterized protein RJT20DRAFT_14957 [Scheffersomyces xylosifermentans]|uniref:uncharacterized protein n=1 Tax=Scheffersomyces xylosifermentans TaxID=1304137 RepID=UPI00315CDD40